MKLLAYYNEIDTFCCDWLSNLMDVGVITPGYIDNRSIEDVTPDDVSGYTRVGFFAGIGVWDYALRLAGWPEDRPVWHGSCPCQPFSSAGKGKGFADERHLWPEFYRLISQCRPTVCLGEQVASKDGLAWVELVQDNMEGAGYAFGAVDSCAAGFGAPHIRQRLYWVGADTLGDTALWGCVRGEMGNEAGPQCQTLGSGEDEGCGRDDTADDGACVRLAHTTGEQEHQEQQRPAEAERRWCADESSGCRVVDASQCPGPVNGHWRDADWLLCRDGKWRATQSIVIEMADGLADRLGYSRFGDRWSLNPLVKKTENRVGRLRGYGNAIVAPQAAAFIESFMEIKEHQPCLHN